MVSVLASGAAAAAEVEPFVGIDVLHHMALVDFDSDCFVAGGTAAVPCFAACVVSGQAVALGVPVFQGTAQAAAVVVAAANGKHAGCLLLLAELDMLLIVALFGIPVAEGVLDRTAVFAIGGHLYHVWDKTGDVLGPGQNDAQGTHAEFLGCVVLDLVVAVVAVVAVEGVVEAVEKFVSDCHVVCIADNLVVAAAHDMETAAAAVVVVVVVVVVVAVVVLGDLEMLADFPTTLQIH